MERILPIGLAMIVSGRSVRRRWLYGLGTVPIALALVLTFSRGAWILGVPALVVVLLWLRGGRLRWLAPALIVAGLLAIFPLMRIERFSSLFDFSQGTSFIRVNLWRSSLQMLRDHPWWGVGPDNFLYYYGDYIQPGAEVERWLSHPHNLVLDFWLRLGIGGVLTLVLLLTGALRSAYQALRRLDRSDQWAMTLGGLIAGLAAAVVHGCVDSFFFVTELSYWLLFALAWLERQPKQRARRLL